MTCLAIMPLPFFQRFHRPTLYRHLSLSHSFISCWTIKPTGHLHTGASSSVLFPGGSSPLNPKVLPSCNETFSLFLYHIQCHRPLPPHRTDSMFLCILSCRTRPGPTNWQGLPLRPPQYSNLPRPPGSERAVLIASVETGAGRHKQDETAERWYPFED